MAVPPCQFMAVQDFFCAQRISFVANFRLFEMSTSEQEKKPVHRHGAIFWNHISIAQICIILVDS